MSGANEYFGGKNMLLNLAHTRLDIFRVSKELLLLCYKASKLFPADEKFALTQQIRRAAVSVHLNIAEGCSRKSLAERKRFFEISRSSLIEIDTALDIALELGYLNKEDINMLSDKMIRFQMLSKMINP
jgi:four helix bundle protein